MLKQNHRKKKMMKREGERDSKTEAYVFAFHLLIWENSLVVEREEENSFNHSLESVSGSFLEVQDIFLYVCMFSPSFIF